MQTKKWKRYCSRISSLWPMKIRAFPVFCLLIVLVMIFVTFPTYLLFLGKESASSLTTTADIAGRMYCFTRHTLPGSGNTSHPVPCFPLDVDYGNYSDRRAGRAHPSTPLDGVLSVEQRRIGLYATFDTSDIPPAPAAVKRRHSHYASTPQSTQINTKKLKVAVHLSGHLRTFQLCASSLKGNILAMNEAVLFLVTYPTLGNKGYGVPKISHDDPPLNTAMFQELIYHYRPHLAGMLLVDFVTMQDFVRHLFSPMVARNEVWSLVAYQFFTMGLVNDMSEATLSANAAPRHKRWNENMFLHFSLERTLYARDGERSGRVTYEPFDVVIRVRPDLFIMGPLWVEPLLTAEQQRRAVVEWHRASPASRMVGERDIVGRSFAVYFLCNETSFPPFIVPPRHIVRAPYHPRYPQTLSDFSAIVSTYGGDHGAPGTAFHLFHRLALLPHDQQEKEVVFRNNSAEKLLLWHLRREGYYTIKMPGWYFLLRNATILNNSSFQRGRSRAVRRFRGMFIVTNVTRVQCAKRV